MKSACSKPYKFIRAEPKSSPFDIRFVKFGLLKRRQTKFEDLSVTNQFDLLVKYTAMLYKVININDKVHVLGNHGTPVWADRGVDSCIPWQVNMTCPFNTYNENDKQVTFCTMPKEVYEDRYYFLAHLYLFHILKEPYRAWCQLTMTDAYGKTIQCESSEIKPNDCRKHYIRHGFDEVKAPNYCIYLNWRFRQGANQLQSP